MKLKTFFGTWDSWGFEISVSHYSRSLTIGLLHWYVAFEIWTKDDIRLSEENREVFREWLKDIQKIKPISKEAKKPVKKAAKKAVKKAVKKK
jgi:hypothetical protein